MPRKQYIATECGGQIRIAQERTDEEAIRYSWGSGVRSAKVIARAGTQKGISQLVRQHTVDPTGKIQAKDVNPTTASCACYEGRHKDCGNVVARGEIHIRCESCTCPCHRSRQSD